MDWSWPCRRPPHVLHAMRVPFGPPQSEQVFAHRDCHALHLHDYSGRWYHDEVEHVLGPGDLTCSPRNIPTRYRLDHAGHHWCLHLAAEGPDDGPRLQLPAHLPLEAQAAAAGERFARIALHLADARGDPAHPAQQAADAAALELIAWLAARSAAGGGRHRVDLALEEAAELLAQDLDRDRSVGEIAARVGVSRNYLAARFKQRFGVSMPRFRQRARIARARILLATTTLPVQAVGRLVGIPDRHYFHKLFRREVGAAPSACRRRLDRR